MYYTWHGIRFYVTPEETRKELEHFRRGMEGWCRKHSIYQDNHKHLALFAEDLSCDGPGRGWPKTESGEITC